MNIKVEFTGVNISERFDEVLPAAVLAVSKQALKDCNYFCKLDTKTLINTSCVVPVSDGKTCELQWTTDYAAEQYYHIPTRRGKNPNAGPRWCDKGYDANSDKWLNTFVDALHRGGL